MRAANAQPDLLAWLEAKDVTFCNQELCWLDRISRKIEGQQPAVPVGREAEGALLALEMPAEQLA